MTDISIDEELERDNQSDDQYSPPKPLFNSQDYANDLRDLDLTEEQRQELLKTLWSIMSMMVDLGWGLDTVQMFLPNLFNQTGNNPNDKLMLDNSPSETEARLSAQKESKND